MRITKVVATNSQTNESKTFVFGSGAAKPILPCENLCSYLEFCFADKPLSDICVEVEFCLAEKEFYFAKLSRDGKIFASLRQKDNLGSWNTLAENDRAEKMLRSEVALSFSSLPVCVNAQNVSNFHGDLAEISQLRPYIRAREDIARTCDGIRERKDAADNRVRTCGNIGLIGVSAEQLRKTEAEAAEVTHRLVQAVDLLNAIKTGRGEGGVREEVSKKLEIARRRYKLLLSYEEQADKARVKAEVAPKRAAALRARILRDNCRARCAELRSELEWKQKELDDVVVRHEQRQSELSAMRENRNRIDAVNGELTYIAGLHSQNTQLNLLAEQLSEKKSRYEAEQADCAEQLAALEKSLEETRATLQDFHIPSKTVGELTDEVRLDVRIDETASQITQLQDEINVRETQIAEKESGLVIQKKRFRSVADLDVAVSPIKAKDTILQVLDTKFSKLEAINASLFEKQRNLERALDDYNFKISQLEQSRAKLVSERDKALLRKQEEFKREVYLNSQKIYGDDKSSVFAVSASFQDAEIQTLEQEISERNADRDQLVQRAARLDGAIKEIKRHTEINSAEMETLRVEKENINKRYNEIVSQNNSEAVYNYLKALHNDTATKYLLDMQQDAVKSESEVAELRRYTDALKQKCSALKARLAHLKETKAAQKIDGDETLEMQIAANDRLRDGLSDVGEHLSVGYMQYVAARKQADDVAAKLQSVNSALSEISKTVKVNLAQIKKSTEKAQKYAGSDDPEQAVLNFDYELGDIESEVQMLAESKQALSREVFEMRLELKQAQWEFEQKSADCKALAAACGMELDADCATDGAASGSDIAESVAQNVEIADTEDTDGFEQTDAANSLEAVEAAAETEIDFLGSELTVDEAASAQGESAAEETADDLEQDLETLRAKFVKYTNLKARLAEKIKSYQSILKNLPEDISDSALLEQQKTVDGLLALQKETAALLREQSEQFATASATRSEAAAAVAEAQNLASLQPTLKSMEVASLVFADKISAFLNDVAEKATALANQTIKLREKDGKLVVEGTYGSFTYDSLPQPVKTAVFTALTLSASSNDTRCLVFDPSAQVADVRKLSELLSHEQNVCFAADCATNN